MRELCAHQERGGKSCLRTESSEWLATPQATKVRRPTSGPRPNIRPFSRLAEVDFTPKKGQRVLKNRNRRLPKGNAMIHPKRPTRRSFVQFGAAAFGGLALGNRSWCQQPRSPGERAADAVPHRLHDAAVQPVSAGAGIVAASRRPAISTSPGARRTGSGRTTRRAGDAGRCAAGEGEGAGAALPRSGSRAVDDVFRRSIPRIPKAIEVLTRRIEQAAAAGIPQVLTFGHTSGDNRKLWVARFKQLGPIARDHGVLIVVKQHGETGQVTGEIVREVADDRDQGQLRRRQRDGLHQG